MKKEAIISVLKEYINHQLCNINVPIINICKPIIKRVIDNNISKVDSFLDLLKDQNNEIDIINIVDEMMDNLFDCDNMNIGIFNFENNKINISLLGQKIIITKQDMELLKEMLRNM